YGRNQSEPLWIDTGRQPAGGAKMSARNQRLNLNQQGTGAFHTAKNSRARTERLRLRQEERRRLLYRPQARRQHLENAEFIGRARSVLNGPHDPVRMLPRALEIKHGIHDMLESFRSRNSAVLRDVSDEEDRDVILLRPEQQLRGHFAHLSNTAGSRF